MRGSASPLSDDAEGAPAPPGQSRRRGFRPATDEELARIGRALAHPARIRLLRALAELGATAQGPLARAARLAQPAASKHLGVLLRAGFVQRESTKYRLVRANLIRLRMLIARL